MIDIKTTGSDRVSLVQQNTTPFSLSAANAYGSEQAAATGKVESGSGLPQNIEKIAEVTNEQVRNAVSKLNDYVQSMERTLDFQMDEESGKTVIKVFDKTSSELIRQMPNELALKLAQNLNYDEPSLLFSAQV
jgi:flagellar protein FlaG